MARGKRLAADLTHAVEKASSILAGPSLHKPPNQKWFLGVTKKVLDIC